MERPDAVADREFFVGIGPAATTMRALVRGYQLFVSPWLGANCRYLPTCSEYAIEAVETHGALRGGWLALRRLLRCHPWGGSGLDPVPAATHDHTECAHDSAAHRHRRADPP